MNTVIELACQAGLHKARENPPYFGATAAALERFLALGRAQAQAEHPEQVVNAVSPRAQADLSPVKRKAIQECFAVLRPAVKDKFPQEQALAELLRHVIDLAESVQPEVATHGRLVKTPESSRRDWVPLTDAQILASFSSCHIGFVYPQDGVSGPRAMRLTEGRAIEALVRGQNHD